jgi:ribosomal protein L11 methyltransferase
MKYIEVKICTSKQGIEYITAFLMARGVSETSIKGGEDIKELIEKVDENDSECISSDIAEKDEEPEVTFWLEETEENRSKVMQMKIDIMMLKSDELYMELGKDTDLGRLYMEDRIVSDDDWKHT